MQLTDKLLELANSIKRDSALRKCSYSQIYSEPLSHIRALDQRSFDTDEYYPAYIAVKPGAVVPKRLQDSGICTISNVFDCSAD